MTGSPNLLSSSLDFPSIHVLEERSEAFGEGVHRPLIHRYVQVLLVELETGSNPDVLIDLVQEVGGGRS